ncbi:helix-turn-helix transcriptional regulator [Enterococcus sp. AZ109]|uniref:helix-turn-helix transcriptional regulator n=1 Tax=Enterococcus sp. AZ109 TaxID=2774634 RepID=UPI003F1F8A00
MTIGKKLQERRKELNLTQGEVAKQLYVSRQAISNWELDKNYPDLETVIALSDLYQLSLDVLLKEDQHVVKGIQKTMNRKLWAPLFYTVTGITILICLLVDFILNHRLTWSMIVLLSLMSLNVLATLFVKRRQWLPILLIGSSSLLLVGYLGLLDRVLLWSNYSQVSFFLPIALPVSLVWLSLVWLVTLVHLRMKWRVYYSLSLLFLLGIVGGFLTNLIVGSEPLWFSVLTSGFPCLFLGIFFSFLGNYSADKL